MKKMTMLSLAVAAILLLSGCEQKGSNSNDHQSQAQKTTQQEASKATPSVAQESSKASPKTQGEEKPAQTEKEAASAKKAVEKASKISAQTQESTHQATQSAQVAVDGAALYTKCASCHGPKGEKKALGKSGIIAGMAKEEVLKKLKGYQAGTLNQYGMGSLMKGQVAGLNEAQLEALADYISKLK